LKKIAESFCGIDIGMDDTRVRIPVREGVFRVLQNFQNVSGAKQPPG